MAFKSIGTLAGSVLLKAERTAARRAQNLNGRPPSASDSLPMLPVVDSNDELGKKAEPESPASVTGEDQRQTARGVATFDYGTRMRPVLRLVMGNRELRGVPRREQSSPALASRNSLVLVVDNHSTGSLSRA